MALKHKSGLKITTRDEHDDDASYVVWDGDKIMVRASYLPTLVRYLDMAREIQIKANSKGKKNMSMASAAILLNRRLEESK